MKIVAVIQARMGSTRLPGKVLREIYGETMLSRVVQRVRGSALIDQIVIATSMESADDAIVAECRHLNVAVFRGSEEDVLDRYYQAALAYEADAIVRITSDCPLIDPQLIDRVIQAYVAEIPDYASNTLERTFPRGLDTAVMSKSALFQTWRDALEPYQRTHVTAYLYQNPQRFRLLSITAEADFSHLRWTVDTSEDLRLVRAIYQRLAGIPMFEWHEVLRLLDKEPKLLAINQHIEQKRLEEA